jgi:hypothetical protein
MSRTISLTDDQARKLYSQADAETKKLLESLFPAKLFETKITDRVKSFEDACRELGLNYLCELDRMKNMSADEIAYVKIKTIVRALNEGWKPDWNNSSEYKYYPWFNMNSSGFRSDGYDYYDGLSVAGSRLCLRTRDLAIYAAKQFEDIYKALFTY